MVDFNNENAVTTAPTEIYKLIVLEERQHVTQAAEFYERCEYQKLDGSRYLAEMYGSVRHLWRQLEGVAYRRLKRAKGTEEEPSFEMIDEMIRSARDFEELDQAYRWLNRFIDAMGITKVDRVKNFDDLNTEEANELEGI